MKNCIVAQSGGPTAVINASIIGIFDENLRKRYYKNVYCGLNGIEGILRGDIDNLSAMDYEKLKGLKYTPSSALGSCRYKLKHFEESAEEYHNLFKVLKEMEIETFFYVGGNDSMDTVAKLSKYAVEHNIKDIKFIGIPKTIDNDLYITDHTPGYGSAAKLIATTTLETYLDSSVYTNNGIFILETMGRDTGWLAASATLAQINDKPVADFIYLPEVAFDTEKFLQDVKEKFEEKQHVYIVVSEGIRDKDGNFIADSNTMAHDKFGHAQLGGVCNALKNLIVSSGITSRVKTLELGVIQRCAMHCASETDIEEAHMVGRHGLKYSMQDLTGKMIAIRRVNDSPYFSDTIPVDVTDVANKVKYFPVEWINEAGNHVTKEAIKYIKPLISGNARIHVEDSLPKYAKID